MPGPRVLNGAFVVIAFYSLLCGAGCAPPVAVGTVNATVTLDGTPLKEGVVRIVPLDGKSQTASAVIAEGKFTSQVPVGEMRVEITSPRVVGKRKMYDTPDSPVVEEVVERLPERYNGRSELKLTVKAGSQEETFALKSK